MAALLGALAVLVVVLQRANAALFGEDDRGSAATEEVGAGETAAAAAPVVKLTIPEGFAIRDIAPAVKKVGINPAAYRRAVARARPPKGFLVKGERAPTMEGFLFPATYELPRPPTAGGLVTRQLDAFKEQFAAIDLRYARSKQLSRYDVLKIASLIEREAAAEADRPKIAAVIYNRLAAGMPLGIDATTQYEVGAWREPTGPELRADTPYNTRLRTGLPPTPIANPGAASLRAAAKPARADFLYYVAIPGDAKRRHFFTASFDEFTAYQQANPAE